MDGTGSFDPDGDQLTYEWTHNGDAVATDVAPTLSLGEGSYVFTLTVYDGEYSHSDDVVVTVSKGGGDDGDGGGKGGGCNNPKKPGCNV